MRLTLPKESLISKPWQYRRVYQQGQRLWGKGITLIYLENDQGHDRLGISVGGQKLAVKRNRIKRLIKELYRLNRQLPSQVAKKSPGGGVDLVIATNLKFQPRGLSDIQAIIAMHVRRPMHPAVEMACGSGS